MYSKAIFAATLLGAASALPANKLPALNKVPSKSSGYTSESSPAAAPYEQPPAFEQHSAPAPAYSSAAPASSSAAPMPSHAAPMPSHAAPMPSAGPQGAPSGPPPWAMKGEDRLADFDDLQPVPAVAIQSTGEYMDLYYQGFVTFEAGVNGEVLAGVKPESSPNAIGYGIYSELLDGPPTFYADYADSETKDFDLKSLYYGCSINTAESLATVPVACTIKATAYDEKDIPVASQEFEYNPRAAAADMEKVEFGRGFEHVKKVQFDTTATADAVVATLFDDVEYTIYKTSPFDEFHH